MGVNTLGWCVKQFQQNEKTTSKSFAITIICRYFAPDFGKGSDYGSIFYPSSIDDEAVLFKSDNNNITNKKLKKQ